MLRPWARNRAPNGVAPPPTALGQPQRCGGNLRAEGGERFIIVVAIAKKKGPSAAPRGGLCGRNRKRTEANRDSVTNKKPHG